MLSVSFPRWSDYFWKNKTVWEKNYRKKYILFLSKSSHWKTIIIVGELWCRGRKLPLNDDIYITADNSPQKVWLHERGTVYFAGLQEWQCQAWLAASGLLSLCSFSMVCMSNWIASGQRLKSEASWVKERESSCAHYLLGPFQLSIHFENKFPSG